MSRWVAFLALTRYTAERLAAPERMAVNVPLFAFPVLVAWGFAPFVRPDRIDVLAGGVFVYGNLYILLLAASLYNALAVTSRELEDGTAPYLYSGILPRWAVFLDRFAVLWALSGAAWTLSALGTFLLLKSFGLTLSWRALASLCTVGLAGLGALSALYMALGALFRHAMAASLMFTVIWEAMVLATPTRLWPFTVAASVRTLVRNVVYEGSPPAWLLRLVEFNEKHGIRPWEGHWGFAYLGSVAVAALAVGAWAISRRQIAGPESPE